MCAGIVWFKTCVLLIRHTDRLHFSELCDKNCNFNLIDWKSDSAFTLLIIVTWLIRWCHLSVRSTTNLSKSKELSGSRISLSNKMSNFKAAAKSKFKTLRKAVSLDKGINKTHGEFRPEALEGTFTDQPLQGKPPKPKKGRSLKKLFARKSSKHRSTDNPGPG